MRYPFLFTGIIGIMIGIFISDFIYNSDKKTKYIPIENYKALKTLIKNAAFEQWTILSIDTINFLDSDDILNNEQILEIESLFKNDYLLLKTELKSENSYHSFNTHYDMDKKISDLYSEFLKGSFNILIKVPETKIEYLKRETLCKERYLNPVDELLKETNTFDNDINILIANALIKRYQVCITRD